MRASKRRETEVRKRYLETLRHLMDATDESGVLVVSREEYAKREAAEAVARGERDRAMSKLSDSSFRSTGKEA